MGFVGDTLQQGVELLPVLVQIFDKAASQQQLTTEAATIACLIAKLLTAEPLPGKSFNTPIIISAECLIIQECSIGHNGWSLRIYVSLTRE
jgi:hypothetical protein